VYAYNKAAWKTTPYFPMTLSAWPAHWVEQGARRLHLVDLNGAFAGEPIHGDIVKAIAAKYPDLPIQIGGGIRSLATIQAYVDAGVILGHYWHKSR
jgi:phosphoribosylformimino-5-aminoimidazole carboxamide ribonucleotide (ProFAR) isomerase